MNAREKAWTYYRDVVLEKSGEMICGEIFLKMAANVFVLEKCWFVVNFCSQKCGLSDKDKWY